MAKFPFTSALVTGASSGIGEAMAEQLAAAGVDTVVVARRKDRLNDLAAAYPNIEVLVADLLTDSGQEAVIERLAASPIELMVNNAGFGTSGPFAASDAATVGDEITLNVAALTRLSHAAIATMVPRRRGWLLNVSSVASFQPAPDLAVYAATKAYVTSLSESLHEELRSTGVKVTALCPGLTKTEFMDVSNTSEAAERLPDFAFTTVEEVAREGLRGAANGVPIVVPGNQYKLLAAMADVTPRWLLRRAAGLMPRPLSQ